MIGFQAFDAEGLLQNRGVVPKRREGKRVLVRRPTQYRPPLGWGRWLCTRGSTTISGSFERLCPVLELTAALAGAGVPFRVHQDTTWQGFVPVGLVGVHLEVLAAWYTHPFQREPERANDYRGTRHSDAAEKEVAIGGYVTVCR